MPRNIPAPETSQRPLSIGFVSPGFPHTSLVFEQNELLALGAAGAQVTLMSCRSPRQLKDQVLHGFAASLQARTLYFCPGRLLTGLGLGLLTRPLRLVRTGLRALGGAWGQPERAAHHLAAWALAVAFWTRGRRDRWDWIHADFAQGTATTAWHLSVLLGLPFSIKAHAFDIYSNKPAARERPEFFRRKMEAAALVTVVSDYGLKVLLSQVGDPPGEPGGKNRIHFVSTRPAEVAPLAPPAGEGRPMVAALGRFVAKKGFEHLVRAVALLRDRGVDAGCVLWGGGGEEDAIRAEVARLGLEDRVRLEGPYTQADLPRIFGEAIALVVPSVLDPVGDMDGIPTVIYEAQAFGRPVVGTRLSGIPEVIREGETGHVVPPGDEAALADAIAGLVGDPARTAAMGRAAREYVLAHHDHRRNAALYLEWFGEHLNRT